MAGIYIHIPFCATRCHYCDFFSTTSTGYIHDFVKALLCEIEIHKNNYDQEIETIYFGGGTPSFISTNQLKAIVEKIKENFHITSKPEITLEANPDDLTEQKISELKAIGFNRLSIGIQSFHNDELELMNRRHNAEEAINAVKNAQDAGFDNISIDLIYGIPGQDIAIFDYSIVQALKMDIQHISAYHLTYEPGTLFYQKLKQHQIDAVAEDVSVDLFQHLRKKLQAHAFEHYEISNFAKGKKYSKHNTNYWKNLPYLGLGPSAHSYYGKTRRWNVANMIQYINGLQKGIPVFEEEQLTTIQQMNEYIMISLRTRWGIDMNYFEKQFGKQYLDQLNQKAAQYFIKNLLKAEDLCIRTTEKGMLISDTIIADLFFEEIQDAT